ncbi:MAG: redox-regulated ATPase YchF [Dehalococcoidales bacterium]|nr:redox-regulated ATPase YchF [Dehalococcoidales bacterium]
MSVGIGIIGLSESGRTTIFNALTKGSAATGSHAQKMPHIGITKVPDARLTKLADMFNPKKIVPAEIKYLDIGASIKGIGKDASISGEYLTQLNNVDALINVVRSFTNDSIPHPSGSIDPGRDINNMNMELSFSDLTIIERRMEKIINSLKSAKADERQQYKNEQEFLTKIKTELEKDIPLREQNLPDEEKKLIAGYQFLSAKPLLTIVNIGEDQLPEVKKIEEEMNAKFGSPNHHVIALCGNLEMELAQLEDEESAATFRSDFGLTEPGLDRAIKQSYALLGLISFLTTGADECRAWPITSGTNAQKAAGKIHSDIERGFIRAEIISYEDLVHCGSLAEGKKRGLLRLEGKTYIVKDGDIINFLFNV